MGGREGEEGRGRERKGEGGRGREREGEEGRGRERKGEGGRGREREGEEGRGREECRRRGWHTRVYRSPGDPRGRLGGGGGGGSVRWRNVYLPFASLVAKQLSQP